MKAVVITKKGDAGVLQLQDIPTPTPAENEVLIEVKAAGLNHTDIAVRQGNYGNDPTGEVPGVEVAGIIKTCGTNVTKWKPGDKVCALMTAKGYAEYAVANEDLCLPMPENMSFEHTASLVETMFTVWDNVFELMHLKSDETLLVHGATSGIGVSAIQMAKAFGATVYATAGSDEKCKFAENLGASKCINYKEEDFEEVLKDKQINVILDYIGGDYTAKNIRLLSMDGRMCNIAALKGADVQINIMDIMRKRLTITGTMLKARDIYYKAKLTEKVAKHVWPLIKEGKINAIVYKTFPLAQAADAQRLMESSEHIGKIVLTIG